MPRSWRVTPRRADPGVIWGRAVVEGREAILASIPDDYRARKQTYRYPRRLTLWVMLGNWASPFPRVISTWIIQNRHARAVSIEAWVRGVQHFIKTGNRHFTHGRRHEPLNHSQTSPPTYLQQ